MSKSHVVLGLGFGDEGKGLTTDYLVSKSHFPLVIRTTGGQQAGHTVVVGEKKHVFSNLGAGTLRQAPTFWSRFCTFSPSNLNVELDVLNEKNIQPLIYVDKLCPLTTPFDQLANKNCEITKRNGTCGMGFGKTLERHSLLKITAGDLNYPSVLKIKLKLVAEYYNFVVGSEPIIKNFIETCEQVLTKIKLVDSDKFFQNNKFTNYIFENSQGILLDKHHGFFPNVTRGKTDCTNPMSFISYHKLPMPDIWYVTRTYQTRHGNGPMTNLDLPLNIKENPEETNVYNPYQGQFKKSVLDLDLLEYSLESDSRITSGLRKNLVITCLDQVEGKTKVTKNNVIKEGNAEDVIKNNLSPFFFNTLYSHGPTAESILT